MHDIVRAADFEAARRWFGEAFLPANGSAPARFPVSFGYASSPADFEGWIARREPTKPADTPPIETLLLSNPHTGLECRCVIRVHADFPAVEWVAYFRNWGAADSEILSDIQALDVLFPVDAAAPCRVHHARGSLAQPDDFEPLETPLTFRQGGAQLKLVAQTGKPSTLHLPFFNLETGQGGVIGAIGWTGSWHASFERQRHGVRVRAGMERTHLRLHPGEEVRTPRILLLFWTAEGAGEPADDRMRSHNMLRRLVLAHYSPRPGGQPVRLPLCEGSWGARSAASQLAKIAWLKENDIPAEWFLVEAAWHGDQPIEEAANPLTAGWMPRAGSWFPNEDAYPNGLRPVGEAAAAAGLGLAVWTEPERAYQESDIATRHPEWLLGPVRSGYLDGDNYMLNLGIPEARQFLINLVSDLIREGGLTCFRQDFNDLRVPALFALADPPDRAGMTEIRHVEGLYAFWDALLARHPDLIIDSVAGGGQRIDLEAISRTIVLWRSDVQCWPFDPIAMQTQTQGLALWLPLSAAVCVEPSAYAFRSALSAGLLTNWSSQALESGPHFIASRPASPAKLPFGRIRELMLEAAAMRRFFHGDFYPLLSFSLAPDVWAAWQYDRPDLGEGMVAAFRRHESPFPSWIARLQALDARATYELYSCDDRSTRRMTGRALLVDGFTVTLDEKPGSALFTYKRITE